MRGVILKTHYRFEIKRNGGTEFFLPLLIFLSNVLSNLRFLPRIYPRTVSKFLSPFISLFRNVSFHFPCDFNRYGIRCNEPVRRDKMHRQISRRNRVARRQLTYLRRKIKNKQRRQHGFVCTCTSISSWFGRALRNNSLGRYKLLSNAYQFAALDHLTNNKPPTRSVRDIWSFSRAPFKPTRNK